MKKIKTEYRRSLRNNRMILSFDEEFDEVRKEYRSEFKMLESNDIPGLLKLRVSAGQEERMLEYDITSKQSLSRILELRQIGAGEIKTILIRLAKIIGEIEKYLLSDRGICLEPEYVYADPETLEMGLCYIPGWERDFCTELTKLLSMLLSKIDHRDREGVVFAYTLYQESLKENYIIDDLIRLIHRDGLEKEEIKRQREEEEEEKECGKEAEEISALKKEGFSIKKLFAKRSREESEKSEAAKKESGEKALWEKAAREKDREEFFYFNGMEAAALREENEWKDYFSLSKAGEETKEEAEDKEGKVLHTHTVLLSEQGKEKEAEHRLRSLEKNMEDIELGYFPFVIGKQERVCDYVLHLEEVSRLHLRLDRDGEDFVATDLNSLNGTKIGGRLLENEESAVIRKGDIIEIAGLKYLFS
ncbi:MAG: DUF6382 domain-containing protein [Johnsonella sp.]|nr:DUF6382 domain-containing protein [Johnsonella sp.]